MPPAGYPAPQYLQSGRVSEIERKHNTSNQPAHKIKMPGTTPTVVIWRNLGEKGNSYTSKVVPGSRTNDSWRDTEYLGVEDHLPAAKPLDMSHTWIMHQLAASQGAPGTKSRSCLVPVEPWDGGMDRTRRPGGHR